MRGLALFINAFNFPAWGLWEKAAPALLSGVPVVAKPATVTAWLTQRMVADVIGAGVLPPGALSIVCGSSEGLLDALDPFDVLSFTGSADTAAKIRSHAGVVRHSIRLNIEADSLNSSILAESAQPGSPAFELYVKEVVREMTRVENGIATRGHLRDHARWTAEFARRYFATVSAALREADGNHLVLSCRFRAPVGAEVLAKCVYPAVDVALPHWRDLPAAGAPGAAQPVVAGELSWVDPDFLKAPPAMWAARLTSVELMLRRGRAQLERLARHPAVVGYAWSAWSDEPGEQPPFARGLVHVNGAEAREHTELLTAFNLRAESLRQIASTPH